MNPAHEEMKGDLGYRCPYSPFLEQSTAAINEGSIIHSQPNPVLQEKQTDETVPHVWDFQKGNPIRGQQIVRCIQVK